MDLYEAIRLRSSVRRYKGNPVPLEALARIAEAVRWAPSACNIQPWRFLWVKSEAIRQRMRPLLQEWAFTAPIVVVALGNRKTAWQRDGESVHAMDVAIAMEHLILAATAEGLGTCWICAFNRTRMHAALGLDEEWETVAATPLGYPDDPSPRTERRPLAEIFQDL